MQTARTDAPGRTRRHDNVRLPHKLLSLPTVTLLLVGPANGPTTQRNLDALGLLSRQITKWVMAMATAKHKEAAPSLVLRPGDREIVVRCDDAD